MQLTSPFCMNCAEQNAGSLLSFKIIQIFKIHWTPLDTEAPDRQRRRREGPAQRLQAHSKSMGTGLESRCQPPNAKQTSMQLSSFLLGALHFLSLQVEDTSTSSTSRQYILYYIVLYCIVLYCIILYYIIFVCYIHIGLQMCISGSTILHGRGTNWTARRLWPATTVHRFIASKTTLGVN